MERLEALKKKMDSGKLVKGFFLTMADPMVSEIAGYAGYDYIWIDAEHGPLDRQEIFHHIVAAQGTGCFCQSSRYRPYHVKSNSGYGAGRHHLPIYQ